LDSDRTVRVAPGRIKTRRSAASPETLILFLSPPLLSSPDGGGRRAGGDGIGDAARGGGCGGGAELCSAEVRAAEAGAQLRRAPLVGALRPRSRARAWSADGGGG